MAESPDTPPPDIFDLIAELRRTVGLFDGAMPITPKQAWEEAIAEVERLRADNRDLTADNNHLRERLRIEHHNDR